ncbi:hypothetical protein F2Q68_00001333 [Brassica cretica]|uniref:Uncharacterized protein n=1 Tax=Brassica cretica TaxID=69181 RepID=A0A8S9J404_BRACR|nr:hypothetical protein F2Q68_00001333 [Brassica cretica]
MGRIALRAAYFSSFNALSSPQQILIRTFVALSTQQLYRICTLCKIDDDKDQNVSPDVISNLKLLITDEDEDSRSFSLDNDSSIPFAADEISNCMQEKEFTNVKAAVELADNPNFHFLKD